MCRNTSFTSAQTSGSAVSRPKSVYSARRARVVVAGAQMRVGDEPRAARRVALAPQQQRELRVRLQAEHAVDDLRARVLELLGPVDVRFLVEARHQLDDDRHFLAAPRRLDQRLHQHRVDARAVDRLLDRDDVRIVGRAADELDDRARTSGTGGAAGCRAGGSPRGCRPSSASRSGLPGHERRVLERVDLDLIDQRREPHDVDRTVAAVEIVVGRARTASSRKLRERARDTTAATSSRTRNAELPLRQLALQRLAQVLHFLLVDPQVGVARDAELRVRRRSRGRGTDRPDARA